MFDVAVPARTLAEVAQQATCEVRRAIEHYEHQLAIAREVGDRRGEALALFNSALAFDQLGRRAKVTEWLKEAISIADQIEDHSLVGRARNKLTESTDARGRSACAIAI